MRKLHVQQVDNMFVAYQVSLVITPFYEQVYWIYCVLVLDVKRTKNKSFKTWRITKWKRDKPDVTRTVTA